VVGGSRHGVDGMGFADPKAESRSAADTPSAFRSRPQVAVEGWRIESKHRPIP
jgi:hypothetical protein